jgi:hypothetical protein
VSEENKKLVKVTFEYDLSDGSKLKVMLEGKDAEQWDEWLKQVCGLAFVHNKNPEWGSLNWKRLIQKADEV